MGEIRRQVIERHETDLELVGVCEPNAALHKKIRGYTVWTDVKDVYKARPDIVFVCTPNCFSPAICVESMSRGMHVFCEKPPGRNVADIELIRSGEKGRVKLMFGFNHRFHPGVIKAKVLIDSGRFGRIINLRGLYGKSGGVNFKQSWRNDKKVSGGGILLDQGIHMLDLFRHFAGDFEDIKCFADNAFWNFAVEDNAYVLLRGATGVNAMLHSSATFWKHTFRIDITLEGGYITVEGLLSKTGSYGREQLTVAKRQFEDETAAVGNPAEEITYFDRDLSWDLEVEEFLRCIREERPVTLSSSTDALKVMRLIEKAYIDSGIIAKEEKVNDEKYCSR
jgi:predicted dehydrogenase